MTALGGGFLGRGVTAVTAVTVTAVPLPAREAELGTRWPWQGPGCQARWAPLPKPRDLPNAGI